MHTNVVRLSNVCLSLLPSETKCLHTPTHMQCNAPLPNYCLWSIHMAVITACLPACPPHVCIDTTHTYSKMRGRPTPRNGQAFFRHLDREGQTTPRSQPATINQSFTHASIHPFRHTQQATCTSYVRTYASINTCMQHLYSTPQPRASPSLPSRHMALSSKSISPPLPSCCCIRPGTRRAIRITDGDSPAPTHTYPQCTHARTPVP